MGRRHGGVVVDWAALAEARPQLFDFDVSVLYKPALNEFIALGRAVTERAGAREQEWWEHTTGLPADHPGVIHPREEVASHLPLRVGDYTDFYSSREHATNVGQLFRDPANALLPNWRELPVAYHGRASSLVVSGTPVRRPHGQRRAPGADRPTFGLSRELDYELEVGFVIGRDSAPGRPIPVEEAEDYIFGLVLVNDWSARDIQRWEYRPLGPFLGKNFATTVSPWVVPLGELASFRVPGPPQEPAPLEYLLPRPRPTAPPSHLDVELTATLTPAGGAPTVVCRSNLRHVYWSMAQQLAHHTSNGCPVRVGDLMASGTLSGPGEDAFGSLLEKSRGGRAPFPLSGGGVRTFLEDGDTLTLHGHAAAGASTLDLGRASGTILPAGDYPTPRS